MKNIDLLSISDIDLPTLEQLAVRAIELATCWKNRDMPQTLADARIGSIEELPGWRNPTALALGVAAMGGLNVRVAAKLEGAETVEDLAGYMVTGLICLLCERQVCHAYASLLTRLRHPC